MYDCELNTVELVVYEIKMMQLPIPTSRVIRDDRGVALLLTLSVLAGLILVILAFAHITLKSQKEVRLSQDRIRARLHVESALQKVLALITGDFADPNYPENLFPATKAGQSRLYGPIFPSNPEWDGRYYWVSNFTDLNGNSDRDGLDEVLQLTAGGVDLTPNQIFTDSLPVYDELGWIHLYDETQDYPDDDTPVVARLAFLIIDESGKIDPTAICGTDSAEGSEVRKGLDPSEINLADILSDSGIATKFQPDVHTGGLLPAGLKWFSFFDIIKRFLADDGAAWDNASDLKSVLDNVVPYSYDIEAFFDGNEDKHRFNLGRTDWNDLGVDDIVKDADNFWLVDGVTLNEQNTGGIPWLFNSSEAQAIKNQIAANLIDYCDDDEDLGSGIVNATSDYNGSNTPSYCGNEQVPYINELKFQAELQGSNFVLTLDAEFVNMYGSDIGTGGVLEVKVQAGSDQFATTSLTFAANLTSDVAARSYDVLSGIASTPSSIAAGTSVTNLGITIVSAKLADSSGNLWDYAFDTTVSSNTTSLSFPSRYIAIEVNDPRNNLDTNEWSWDCSPGCWGSTPCEVGTIDSLPCVGNTNNVSNPASGSDSEPGATDPWDVSTAYIRNAPIQYMWELGAVHRGSSWSTINLHTYRYLTIQVMPSSGFASYLEGDANILSQVKLNDDLESSGKVNVNTYNTNVLTGLLTGITIGGGYESPETGVVLANAGTLVSMITSNNGSVGGLPFRFRAQLAMIPEFTNGTAGAQDNDRAKEEIIGKFINITNVRQNIFSFVVSAQIVKDMISGFRGGTRGIFDFGIDLVLAEKRVKGLIYRDALRNRLRVQQYSSVDE